MTAVGITSVVPSHWGRFDSLSGCSRLITCSAGRNHMNPILQLLIVGIVLLAIAYATARL